MNGQIPGGGVPLGGQQVAVKRAVIYPAASVDVDEGSPLPGPATHTIRVVLITEGEMLLFPCDRRYLQSLYNNIGVMLRKEGVTDGD
jgi:hypothetical protein